MPEVYDYLIIGGGVVGSFIARELSRYSDKVLLIEKEADIGMGATCANSAIVHLGNDGNDGENWFKLMAPIMPSWKTEVLRAACSCLLTT